MVESLSSCHSADDDQMLLSALSRDEIEAAEVAAARLERELRASAFEIEHHEHQARRIQLCVDFDVIHSAISNNDNATNVSFWSKLFLGLNDVDFVLLPGTLIELIHFLREQQRQETSIDTAMASAFYDSFTKLKFDQVQLSATYGLFLDHFNVADAKRSVDRLSELITQKLRPLSRDQMVEIDYDVFYRSIVHLSHGTRSRYFRNNRVDAYNLALVKALNDRGSGEFTYIIVSNASAMENLNRAVVQQCDNLSVSAFSEITQPSLVWKPSRAFIYQMLVGHSELRKNVSAIAWALVQRLSSYRVSLSARKQRLDRGDNKRMEPRSQRAEASSDLLVMLLASVEALQDRLDRIKAEIATPIQSKLKVTRDEVKATFSKVSDQLKSLLEKAGFAGEVRELTPPRNVRLNISDVFMLDEEQFHCNIRENVASTVVAGAYNLKGVVGFYFKSQCNLEKFLAVFNFTRQQVAIPVLTGQIEGETKTNAGVILADGESRLELDFEETELPLSTFGLINAAGNRISTPSFVRLNTHFFDISYEQIDNEIIVGIASHLPIGEQIASAVNELIEPSARSTNYGIIFRTLRDPIRNFSQSMKVA